MKRKRRILQTTTCSNDLTCQYFATHLSMQLVSPTFRSPSLHLQVQPEHECPQHLHIDTNWHEAKSLQSPSTAGTFAAPQKDAHPTQRGPLPYWCTFRVVSELTFFPCIYQSTAQPACIATEERSINCCEVASCQRTGIHAAEGELSNTAAACPPFCDRTLLLELSLKLTKTGARHQTKPETTTGTTYRKKKILTC